MPPKKGKSEQPARAYLGRPGNHVSMGIVGMPNVGKSTLFNALSKLHIAAENYPFCTIDPNVAKVPVPDDRYDALCKFHKPKSEVAAVLTITDIAGLVKGASEGKGLGNAFLSHISAVDAIYHVCRAFTKKTIEHVEGSVDPVRDIEIISGELRAKDLERVLAKVEQLEKVISRGIDKTKKAELDVILKVKDLLENGKDVRAGEWNPKEVDVLNTYAFLSAKPVVFLVNVSKKNFLAGKSKWIVPIKKWIMEHSPGSPVIPFSAELEGDFSQMSDEEAKKFCEDNKTQSMMKRIITTGYHTLELIHFFTCGPDEVRAWTIRKGSKAPQAAGTIHTDFERGFICSETMSYEDFAKHGSENAVKAAGRYRTEGKGYVVQDGDICFFKFNVSNSKKK